MDLPVKTAALMKYKGTCLFSSCEVEAIQNMDIRADDTWVLSFPRSGTTVTQEIVYLLKTNLDFGSAQSEDLDSRFPFLDLNWPTMTHFQGLRKIEKMTSPRLIKSHLHYHILPPALFKSNCKKVYIMRNPKDVFVSYIHLSKFMKEIPADYPTDVFLDAWLAGDTYSTPWWSQIRGFLEHRDDPNILFLTYEKLVTDMTSTVRSIATHLDVVVSDDDVDKIVRHCSIRSMRTNSSVNASWQDEHRSVDKTFGGHIRQGQIGGWRDYLTPEMSAKIDTMVKDKLGHLGVQFEFGK